MTNPFTRLKNYIIEKSKIDKQRIEQWINEVLEEKDTPLFYESIKLCCVENYKPKPAREEDKDEGRVYGTTSVTYSQDYKISEMQVYFYIDNFMDYYEEVELEYAKFCFEIEFFFFELISFRWFKVKNVSRWVLEFLYHRMIRKDMKKKIRRTVLHEYRHTEQFIFLAESKVNISNVVDDDNSLPYGKGPLEKDAIRYSEDKIDVPLDQVFVQYME